MKLNFWLGSAGAAGAFIPDLEIKQRISHHCLTRRRKRSSPVVSELAFSARGHGFDPRGRRGKISVSEHAFVSVFAEMALNGYWISRPLINSAPDKLGVVTKTRHKICHGFLTRKPGKTGRGNICPVFLTENYGAGLSDITSRRYNLTIVVTYIYLSIYLHILRHPHC